MLFCPTEQPHPPPKMNNDVRVRYAPSLTGPQHIGGIRTALFNYLFAKRHQGKFILRIEDTDQKRFVPGSEAYIEQTLAWLGITPDESVKKGGPHTPYKQSQRNAIYKKYIDQLLAKGKAYHAFDTPEELEAMRAKQRAIGVHAPKYDTIVRMSMKNTFTLPPDEVKKRLANHEPHVIRLQVDHNATIKFKDEIRGWIQVKGSTLDDKILIKGDGLPTYHLANVVDDHLMKISHVIRGEEWLPSTPIHILLYQAFNWSPPIFAHLPLLLQANGQGKLSKRKAIATGTPILPLNWQDQTTHKTIQGFKETGYLPEALINFLALLGWHPANNQELFTLEELCQTFTLARVNKAGIRFDINKAKWFNQQHLKTLPNQQLANQYLLPQLKKAHIKVSPTYIDTLCTITKEHITFPQQIWEDYPYLFYPPTHYPEQTLQKKYTPQASLLLKTITNHLHDLTTWQPNLIKQTIKKLTQTHQQKLSQIMPLLRIAITGTTTGPDLGKILTLLGQATTIKRVQKAIQKWEKP